LNRVDEEYQRDVAKNLRRGNRILALVEK
jgi:hypothetical protein